MIIGDSHAQRLWNGVRDDTAAHGVMLLAGAGCPFVRNVRVWFPFSPGKDDCPLIMNDAFRALSAAPSVVVLHARMALYFTREGFGEGDGADMNRSTSFVDSPVLPGRTAGEVLSHALREDLTYLTSRGHRVVIVLQVPELGFDVRPCVRLRPYERYLRRRIPECTIPRTVVEERQRSSRRAIRDAVRDVNSLLVSIVDPMNALCDAARCYAVRDGQLLYVDSDHLSADGARYVWSRLKPLSH